MVVINGPRLVLKENDECFLEGFRLILMTDTKYLEKFSEDVT